MIAEIIPYTRTIRGKDIFDYTIPDELSVAAGSMVYVEFRSSLVPGIVRALKQQSAAKKLKPIIEVIPNARWSAPGQLDFLQWFAEYYYVSLPQAFKTIQFPILKRPRLQEPPTTSPQQENPPLQIPKASAIKIQHALDLLSTKTTNLVHYSQRTDCLALYRGVVSQSTGHTLIIVPEYVDVAAIAAVLTGKNVWAFSKEPSPSEIISLEQYLTNTSTPQVVIGTKKMIFLPPALFSTWILDQEEAKSHKQYHLNPRYHVRTVMEKILSLQSTDSPLTCILTSHTPSLEAASNKLQYLDIRRPWSSKHISVVDMEQEIQNKNYTWFSDDLLTALQSNRRSFLFLNRTGDFGIAICQDCSTLHKSTAITCSECNGSNLKLSRKGTSQLERELAKLLPKKSILRVDSQQSEDLIKPEQLQAAEIIIGTEKVLRLLPLDHFDFIGILSVDHLLIYPHFRSHERVFQILIKLFSSQIPTILQTFAPHHTVIQQAVENSYQDFLKAETEIRTILKRPPFGYSVKLIDTKTKIVQELHSLPSPDSLPTNIVVDRQ